MAARTKSQTSRRGAAAKKPATRVSSSRAQTTKSKTAAKPAASKAAAKPAASRGASAAKRVARGAVATRAVRAARGGTKSARPRGGLAQQVKPDATLAAVVGPEPTTRADLTKRIWDYIRKNDLQDSENRRQINADDKLKKVFGGKKQVSMFEMTRLVNEHVS